MVETQKLKVRELFATPARFAEVEDRVLAERGQDAYLSLWVVFSRAYERGLLKETIPGVFVVRDN